MTSIHPFQHSFYRFLTGFSLFLILLLYPALPQALSDPSTAYFKEAFNGVKITKSDGRIKIAAKGDTLSVHDKVETLDRGTAIIAMGQQATIELDTDTTWQLQKLDEGENQKIAYESSLELGKLKAKVKTLKKDSTFFINTPTSVASVRGTIFELNVLAIQDQFYTQIYVSDGIVIFKSLLGDMENQLGPGQSATSELVDAKQSVELAASIAAKTVNASESAVESRGTYATNKKNKDKTEGLQLDVSMAGEKEKNPAAPTAQANIVKQTIKDEN